MKYTLIFLLFINTTATIAQNIRWDDTLNKSWPEGFKKVMIPSSLDHTAQPAIVYKSPSTTPQPLIVSLHTWGGDYLQQDSLSYQVQARGWNYIHPNFRGANNQPKAMGSDAVIKDIDDAIRFAIKTMNVDAGEVHIIGVSGGGYATMLCYMKLKFPAKSFSSWAGISDLKAWYEESVGRKQRYAADILKATSSTKDNFNAGEALKRSPLHMPVPAGRGKLYLYEGIHDGYQGSVPITQTLNFYNHVAEGLYPGHTDILVKQSEMLDMVTKRCLPDAETQRTLGSRKVHYFRDTQSVSVCIFEGNHEQLIPVALALLPVKDIQPNRRLRILTIGDSNGTFSYSWPQQLKYELPYTDLLNNSRSGRTIGFVNNGDSTLNELMTLNADLKNADAYAKEKKFDAIVMCLGTNDAKAVFDKDQEKVAANLESIIQQIRGSKYNTVNSATIVVVSPPPYGTASQSQQKYAGGFGRVEKMNAEFKKIAQKYHCLFVDAFTPMLACIDAYSKDGIHLNAEGQRKLAALISKAL